MDKKYGVYICEGCGIGESLDVKALCGVPEEEGVPVKTHPFLCSKDGVEILKKDIAGGTNTLVIAACSRRVNFDIFRFDGCIVDRVNLREGVVWSHPRDVFPALTEAEKADEDNFDRVQMMAEDYIKMGMIRVEKITLPEPYVVENLSRKILVLGGGITGMSAAIDAAKTGFDVTIVEKTDALGGYAAKVRKQIPVSAPYDALIPPVVEAKIAEVEALANITVKTGIEVARIAGQPGEFTVTLKKPGEKIPFDVPFPLPDEMKVDENGKELDVEKQHEAYLAYNEGREDILQLDPDGELFGAVILAAGWRPDDLKDGDYAHLGYGELPDVITNHEFEELAKAGKIVRPSDGKPAKSVVFVQSPGKDDSDSDFAYAGAVTSMVSLKQAKYVREDYDDGKAFIFYQHMRTPGFSELFYKGLQQDPGIFMTKGAVMSVAKNGDGMIVDAENTLLGEKLQVKADLVVLGAGMVPVTKDDPVVNGFPVTELIRLKFGATLQLTLGGILVSLLISLPLGILSAIRRGSWIDRVTSIFVALTYAIPTFWLGILLVIVFALQLRWLPPSGRVEFSAKPLLALKLLILPSLTLGLYTSAVLTRFLKTSLLEIMGQDFVRTARAKGLNQRGVVIQHMLKNAFIPFITVFGLQIGVFLGGAVVTESIFDWPGMGRMLLNAIQTHDYPVLQGGILFVVVGFVLVNLITDLTYAYLDPRIRYQ